MISKKHLILNKARLEFEKRIEQGESIAFNFVSHNETQSVPPQKKRRVVRRSTTQQSDLTTEPSQDKITSQLETVAHFYTPSAFGTNKSTETRLPSIMCEEPPVSLVASMKQPTTSEEPIAVRKATRSTTTRRRSSSGAQEPASTGAGSGHSRQSKNSAASQQAECCLVGCENPVTNRLRFSLRCHKDDDFKADFISQGFNKVCHYHYFADLYQFKKATRGVPAGNKKSTSPKRNPPPPLPSVKRSRAEFDANTARQVTTTTTTTTTTTLPVVPIMSLPPVASLFEGSILNNTNSFVNPPYLVSQRCSTTATTPVKAEDATVFFNFVELNQNTKQQQRCTM